MRAMRYLFYLGSFLLFFFWRTDEMLATERPPILGIAHVAWYVGDLAKAQAFYGDFLGFSQPLRFYKEDGSARLTIFKINDRQFIEIIPGLATGQVDHLASIALETTDVEVMGVYLKEKGIPLTDKVNKAEDGSLTLSVKDPDGHAVKFVQYLPDSVQMKIRGSYLGPERISDRITHVGLTVSKTVAADRFYKDVLGFSEIWKAGLTSPGVTRIALKVPEGTDAVEYMVVTGKVEGQSPGALHHLSMRVPDIQMALERLRERLKEKDTRVLQAPALGETHRWHLNLLDPDGNRIELMEPFAIY